jgi:hypothetical protein
MFYKTETLFQLQIYFEKLTEYFAIYDYVFGTIKFLIIIFSNNFVKKYNNFLTS